MTDVPADVTVICNELPAIQQITVTDDALPVDIVYSQSMVPGINDGEFNVTRTWTVTDACGNSASAAQSIFWIPDTFLECDLMVPGLVDCNTHGVAISSLISGGIEPLTFEWEVEG